MKVRSGLVTADDETHDENRLPSMKRDEQQVADLISHLQEKMINLFDIQQHPSKLINVSMGLKASKEVQEWLPKSVDTFIAMVKTFVGSALSVGKSGSLYGPIKRSNIKTFSDMNKKTKLKCRSGETVQGNINPELTFRRALALMTCRDDVTVKNYFLSLLDPYRLPCSTMTAPCENVSRLILLMNLNVRYVHLSLFLHLTKHLQF